MPQARGPACRASRGLRFAPFARPREADRRERDRARDTNLRSRHVADVAELLAARLDGGGR